MHKAIQLVSGIRKILLRHLFLRRPEILRKHYIPSAPNSRTGRYNSVEYLSHPWYVEPSFNTRWGPKAWITWALRRKLPGDDGNKYSPEGYRFDELGPTALKGKGTAEMKATRLRLTQRGRGGCPFR